MLYREPKLLKVKWVLAEYRLAGEVSVLYREPKLLKGKSELRTRRRSVVSVLYREPKLLKGVCVIRCGWNVVTFQCSTVSRNC